MARTHITEGFWTDSRLKGTESPEDRKHRERMDRIRANPKAHAAFKNRNWERQALGSAYKRAAMAGGFAGGALGAIGTKNASPRRQALGVTAGSVLGAGAGLGLVHAERRFWTRGPKKTSKWYANQMDRAEARAADPKRLRNKIRYALTRSPKNEEADMYEDVATWLNEQGVTREDLIYALIEAEMSDDEKKEARKGKLKKWGKRAAAVGAGLGAAAAGGYVYKNRKRLGAQYQAAREVGSMVIKHSEKKAASSAGSAGFKDMWNKGKKTGEAAGRLLRMKLDKINKATK